MLLLSIAFLAGGNAAWAAGGAEPHASESLFIGQIIVLLGIGRLLGEGMQRLGQPAIMGQLLAGLLLGPSFFGALLPDLQHMLFPSSPGQKTMLEAVSQLGILLMLLLTGMETDMALIGKMRRAAFSVSVAGIAVPFACGVALGQLLPDALLPHPEIRLITSLFLGVALAISSVKIVAVVVQEMGFLRRRVGQLIIASAIIDDTIGWILIAVIFGLALHGGVEPGPILFSVVGTLVFLAASLTLGQRLVSTVIRWVNDNFVSEFAVITAILVMMGGMSILTAAIGVHTVLGAFVAGVLIGRSPILTQHIRDRLRGLVVALFMPVFFGTAGLSADLTVLTDPTLLMVAIGLVAIASLGKFGGAYVGGMLASLPSRECLALGCGMNARGSTEVVIATIGLSMGALSETLYSMIVAMAVITTTAMPPMLRWALARLPISKEEQDRLTREEMEEQGFVANVERLLVVADQSANGQLASRLAGLLSVSQHIPLTVLEVDSKSHLPTDASERTARHAASGAASEQEAEEATDPDITSVQPDSDTDTAVTEEAKKGYGLLFVGLAEITGAQGGVAARLPKLTASFTEPLCVVEARDEHATAPASAALDMLVPVSGTTDSRQALEIAVALARADNSTITLLYVEPRARPSERAVLRQSLLGTEGIELREAMHFAEQYDVSTRTISRSGISVEDAIVAQCRRGGHTLVLLGVRPRSSDRTPYGTVAAEVLERSPCSVMLVSD